MFFGRKHSSLLLCTESLIRRAESTLTERMKGALLGTEMGKDKEKVEYSKMSKELDGQGTPFRQFFVMPSRKLRIQQEIMRLTGQTELVEKPKIDINDRNAIRRPRNEEMKTDQDWPSVWPVAASFRSSVVPLPVRMGTRKYPDKRPPFKTVGNLELIKIPNFLHLTPGAIERHCRAIKKFCTKWPSALNDSVKIDETNYPVVVSMSDYVHQGTSLRDSRSRVVTVKVKLSALCLNNGAKEKMMRLVGDRYCPETDVVTLITDRCYSRKQNLDYAMYLLTALYHESNKVESWEKLIQKEDNLKMQFVGSNVERVVSDILVHSTSSTDKENLNLSKTLLRNQETENAKEKLKQFGNSWEKYRNTKESPETVEQYAEAVKNLLSISSLDSGEKVRK